MTTASILQLPAPVPTGPHILDVGGFAAVPSVALRAAVADGMTSGFKQFLGPISAYDALGSTLQARLLRSLSANTIKTVGGLVDRAYDSVLGVSSAAAFLNERPELDAVSGASVGAIDLYKSGAAAANTRLVSPAMTGTASLASFSFAVAFRLDVIDAVERYIFDTGTTTSGPLRLRKNADNTISLVGRRRSSDPFKVITPPTVHTPGWKLFIGTANISTGLGKLYEGGNAAVTLADFYAANVGSTLQLLNAQLSFGCRPETAGAANPGGAISELHFFNGELSDSEAATIRTWLRARMPQLP